MQKPHLIQLFFVFIFLLICQSSWAIGTIKGVVVHSNNSPVEFANVVLYEDNDSIINGILTDVNGKFSFTNLSYGNYYVKVSLIGFEEYKSHEIQIREQNKKVDLKKLQLNATSYLIEEATVTADNDYITYGLNKKTIHVEKQLTALGGSAADALQNAPSVQVDGNGDVTMRGSSNFKLLIDGKPSILNASDALQQIPAETISKIEIITNPSVKYASDGAVGIINLITKKQKFEGTSGKITTVLGTNKKLSIPLFISHKKNRNAFQCNFSFSDKIKDTNSETERTLIGSDENVGEIFESNRKTHKKNYELTVGWNHDFSENSTFGLSSKIGNWSYGREETTDFAKNQNIIDEKNKIIFSEDFMTENKYVSSDFIYTYKFPETKKELAINGFYSRLVNKTPSTIMEDSIVNGTRFFLLENSIEREYFQDQMQLKFDFKQTFSENFVFETGYEFNGKLIGSEYNYLQLPAELDINNNEEVKYTLYENAFYGLIYLNLGKYNFSSGLRFLVDRNIMDNSGNEILKNQKKHLFPSLQMSRQIKENQQVSLSYSKRINRPGENKLTPFPLTINRYNIESGNPELKNEMIHALELNHNYKTKKITSSFALFSRFEKNAFQGSMYNLDGTYYSTYENIDKKHSSGIEGMINMNVNKWFKFNLAGSYYNEKLEGKLSDNYIINDHGFTYDLRSRATFLLQKNTHIVCMTYYYGPRIFSRGEADRFYYIDFIIKQYLFDRQLIVYIRTHNTFDTGTYSYFSSGTNYRYDQSFVFEGPTIYFGVSYKFNNYRAKYFKNKVDMNFDSGLDL